MEEEMNRLYLVFILLLIVSGLIATPSSMNPLSERAIGWYEPSTRVVYCFEKWECLHECVHKYDYDGTLYPTISTTERFHKAVDDYIKEVGKKENTVYLERFIYNFPGVSGNELAGYDWGGYHELFAEIFTVTEMKGLEIPEEFIQFYDNGIIYKLWGQYPNIRSRL